MAHHSFPAPKSDNLKHRYLSWAVGIVSVFLTFFVVTGFTPLASVPDPEPPSSRIKHIESVYPPEMATRISLISVDGVEYICVYRGGIIRHTKMDTCINKYATSWKVTETGVEEE